MEWIPCSITREKYVRCDLLVLLVAEINSSTKTSVRLKKDAVALRLLYADASVGLCTLSYKVWGGICTSCRSESMTSQAVSEAAQKKGGDSHHPIWRHLGTTVRVSSIFVTGIVFGKT